MIAPRAYIYRLCALLMLGSTSFTAWAQTLPEELDISGEWLFSTGPYAKGLCSMSGHMEVSEIDTNGRQACSFTTHENCGEGYGAEVQQLCVITRKGKYLTISSTITKIVHMSPYAYSYAPDDWSLTIKSEREMLGTLVSAHNAVARFTRDPQPIS